MSRAAHDASRRRRPPRKEPGTPPTRLTTAQAEGRAPATGGRRRAVRALASLLAAGLALTAPAGCSNDPSNSGGGVATTAAPGTTGSGETARRPSSTSRESTAASASVVRFRGAGDRVLRPIRVREGGTKLHWTNNGAERVFSLLTQSAIVVDAAFGKGGERFLTPGRYVLEVVASGRWTLTVPNASLRG